PALPLALRDARRRGVVELRPRRLHRPPERARRRPAPPGAGTRDRTAAAAAPGACPRRGDRERLRRPDGARQPGLRREPLSPEHPDLHLARATDLGLSRALL